MEKEIEKIKEAVKNLDSLFEIKIHQENGKIKSYACIGVIGYDKVMVKDGKIIKGYDDILMPTYSPDGKSFAYVIKEDKKYRVVKDGEKLPKYDSIKKIAYSLDGKFFYEALKDRPKGSFDAYIIEEGNIFSEGEVEPFFLNNIEGPIYAFIAKRIDAYNIVLNGEVKKMKHSMFWDCVYSNGSYAYTTHDDDKFIIVKDGVIINGYDFSTDQTFSPDGKSFAFIARQNGKYLIVKDGKEFVCNGFAEKLTYSNTGELAYVDLFSNSKKEVTVYNIVKDGKVLKSYERYWGKNNIDLLGIMWIGNKILAYGHNFVEII